VNRDPTVRLLYGERSHAKPPPAYKRKGVGGSQGMQAHGNFVRDVKVRGFNVSDRSTGTENMYHVASAHSIISYFICYLKNLV
jgi:hypothetical protein